MTKKHFIALADALKESRPIMPLDSDKGRQWCKDVHTIGDCLDRANPQFNRERWLDYIEGKCGPSGGAIKAK